MSFSCKCIGIREVNGKVDGVFCYQYFFSLISIAQLIDVFIDVFIPTSTLFPESMY